MGGVGKVSTAQTLNVSLNIGICHLWIQIRIHLCLLVSEDQGSIRIRQIFKIKYQMGIIIILKIKLTIKIVLIRYNNINIMKMILIIMNQIINKITILMKIKLIMIIICSKKWTKHKMYKINHMRITKMISNSKILKAMMHLI